MIHGSVLAHFDPKKACYLKTKPYLDIELDRYCYEFRYYVGKSKTGFSGSGPKRKLRRAPERY